MASQERTMSFLEHVGELRVRVIWITIILLLATCIAIFFSKEIYSLLATPLVRQLPNNSGFIALSPIEGWLVYLKVAFVTALFATAPLWFYQIWAFVAPAFAKDERRLLIIAALSSAICFLAGGAFGYFIVLPTGFHYLIAVFDKTNIALLPQMQWYLSFIIRVLFAFGMVFETPVILVLLSRLGVVSVSGMRRARRYVIVGIFVFAAIITPGPDVFSQIAVAIPLIAFYELGIIAAAIAERKSTVVTSKAI